jgi:hypothetical protein
MSGRVRGIGMVIGSVLGAAGVVKQVQAARRDDDRLMLANAAANALVVLTGLAMAVRTLRGGRG